MRTVPVLIAILIALALVASALVAPQLPARIASHWDAQGGANRTLPKAVGLFLLPAITAALALLLWFIPSLDPLRKNVAKFRRYYDLFILALVAMLVYVHFVTLLWNLGMLVSIPRALALGFCPFTIALGALLGKTKRNWLIGVRTPWTLSSDRVWDRTHALAGRLFMGAGIVMLLGVAFPRAALWLVVGSLMLSAVVSVVYSYVAYRDEQPSA